MSDPLNSCDFTSEVVNQLASRWPPTGSTPTPACFLDRDNTLVRDDGYVHRPEDLELLPGVVDGLRLLRNAGWLIFVVTNQAGVAKGHFEISAVDAFHSALKTKLAESGLGVDEIRFCPHHPKGIIPEFTRECEARKPRPGMLDALVKKWNVDRTRSYVLGDQLSDVSAAESAGMRGILVSSGGLKDSVAKFLLSDMNHN